MLKYLLWVLALVVGIVCGTFLAPWAPWVEPRMVVAPPPAKMTLDELLTFYEQRRGSNDDRDQLELVAAVPAAETNPDIVTEMVKRLNRLESGQPRALLLVELAGWFPDKRGRIADVLTKKLTTVEDPSLQWASVVSLRKMGSHPSPDELLPLMSSKEEVVRELVVYEAFKIWGKNGKAIYAKCLADSSPEVRSAGFASCAAAGIDVRQEAQEWLRSFLASAAPETLETQVYEGPKDVRGCLEYLETAYAIAPPANRSQFKLGPYAKAVLQYVETVDPVREKARATLLGAFPAKGT